MKRPPLLLVLTFEIIYIAVAYYLAYDLWGWKGLLLCATFMGYIHCEIVRYTRRDSDE